MDKSFEDAITSDMLADFDTGDLPSIDVILAGTSRIEDCDIKPMRKEGNFKCSKCDFSSKRKVMTRKHQFTHGVFQCLYCDIMTDSKDGFEKHGSEHHPRKPGLKTCTKCSLLVRLGDSYQDHVDKCSGKTSVTCQHCGKDFRYEFRLKTHIQKQHSDVDGVLPQYPCDRCDFQAETRGSLLKHMNVHMDYPCKHCDECFLSKPLLRKHLVIHADLRPYVCAYEGCERAFKSQHRLKEHEVLHSDARPFVCGIDECTFAFKTAKACDVHRNEVHNLIEKRLCCSFEGCDQKFYKQAMLKRHENKHNRKYILIRLRVMVAPR